MKRKGLLKGMYLGLDARAYELVSVVAISGGINILSSVAVSGGKAVLVFGGIWFSLGGLGSFYCATQVRSYREAARERQVLEGGGSLVGHLEEIVREEGRQIGRESLGMLCALLFVAMGFVFVGVSAVR